MRRLSLLLAFSAPLLLSGCDFLNRLFGKVDDTVQTAVGNQSAFPSLPEADIRNQGPVSGRQLRNAASAAQLAGGETDPGRVTFDGGTLRDAVGGVVTSGYGSPVMAGAGPQYPPRDPVQFTPGQPRRSDLQAGAPPPPDLTLPPGGPADGSARGAGPTLAQYDAFQRMPGLFRAVYDVVSRAGWGAQAPRDRPTPHTPVKVTVHHTDGPQTMTLADSMRVVKNIQHYHRNMSDRRKSRWDDIGYHFLIDGGGRIFEGRHAEHVGAHAGGGYNTGNIGIAMMGSFERDRLTEPQRDALVRLVTFLSIKYRRDPSANGFIEPHMHYAEMGGGGTDCPGSNVLSFLNSGELMNRARLEITRVGQDSRFRPQMVTPGGQA
jgi:hypothetical protein